MISKAISFATEKHQGQLRKDGQDYIQHPLRVMKKVQKHTNDENMITAAVLHDTIEDTNTTYEEIKNEFNDTVAYLVESLTNDKEEILSLGYLLYSEYISNHNISPEIFQLIEELKKVENITIDKIKKYTGKSVYIGRKLFGGESHPHGDDRTILIKLCDRLDNMRDMNNINIDSDRNQASLFSSCYKIETRFILNQGDRYFSRVYSSSDDSPDPTLIIDHAEQVAREIRDIIGA